MSLTRPQDKHRLIDRFPGSIVIRSAIGVFMVTPSCSRELPREQPQKLMPGLSKVNMHFVASDPNLGMIFVVFSQTGNQPRHQGDQPAL